MKLLPLFLAAALVAAPAAARRVVIPVNSAKTHLYYGKWRTVGGKVVATKKTKRYVYLHFHKDHQDTFTVMIYRRWWKRFPKDIEDYYVDRDVLVRGTIRKRDGRPVIVLSQRRNIWIVGETIH